MMRLLILLFALASFNIAATDESDPVPSPPPETAPATPATPAARDPKEIFLKELAFCNQWYLNITNKSFYLKWNEGNDPFAELSPEGETVFFIRQAENLEVRARKLCKSLDSIIEGATLIQSEEVSKEATLLKGEVMVLRYHLAVKREELIELAIAKHPSLMSGLKLYRKYLIQYHKDNKLTFDQESK